MKNLKNKNYHILNLTFAGLILFIFIYSSIFSAQKNNHPIPSFYTEFTGKDSPSLGLSRSFSEIIRFRFDSAKEFNPYGVRVFLFFFVQLFLRLGISIILLLDTNKIPTKTIVLVDAVFSVGLFIYSFWYFFPVWEFIKVVSCFLG